MVLIPIVVTLTLHGLCAWWAYRIAAAKGRNPETWMWVSLLLPLIGLAIIGSLKPSREIAEREEQARQAPLAADECPTCGCKNEPAATSCRKCHSPLSIRESGISA
jgi:ribosomal protein L40E